MHKFKHDDREYFIIEFVFINFKHTRAINLCITNENAFLLYSKPYL